MRHPAHLLLEDKDRLIRVKSWRPSLGPHGIEWPTMLIDRNGYQRCTVTPVWNWALVRHVFRYEQGPREDGK